MKKSILVALAAVMVMSIVLSACGKDTSVYVDPAGNTYIAVTNEEGNTVLDGNGAIIVYETETDGSIVTNASGEPVTQGTLFPEILVDGDVVQTPTYTVKLPSGWKASTSLVGSYTKKGSSAEIEVAVIDTDVSFEAYCEQNLNVLESILNDPDRTAEFSYTVDSFKLVSANADASVYRTVTKGEDGVQVSQKLIYFMNAGNLYKLMYQANEGDYSEDEFAEFYSAMTFKNVLYY